MSLEAPQDAVGTERRSVDVLIVEDDRVLRGELAELLTAEGYRVGAASDGQAALDFLAAHRVGLVLLDLMLPAVNGWEVLEQLRASSAHGDVPVFIMTAVHNLSRAQGTGPVFLKPLNVTSLLRAVRARIGARH